MSEEHTAPRRTLYRDTRNGKLFGVCAGLAEYFGFERWVVRIIVASLVVFMGPMPVIAYLVLTFILDKKPGDPESVAEAKVREGLRQGFAGAKATGGNGSRKYQPDPLTVWRAGTAPAQVLHNVDATLSKLELRLRALEGFVTSSRFQWEKQFKEINH